MSDSCICSAEGRERTIWLSVGLTRGEWDDAIGWLNGIVEAKDPDRGKRLLNGALEDAWLCADTDACEGCEP